MGKNIYRHDGIIIVMLYLWWPLIESIRVVRRFLEKSAAMAALTTPVLSEFCSHPAVITSACTLFEQFWPGYSTYDLVMKNMISQPLPL